VVFDLFYQAGRSLLNNQLVRRREVLAALCRPLGAPEVHFSEAVVGNGTALYAAALARGHEDIMAKQVASTYRAGRRWAAWWNIKPRRKNNGAARELASD
jgi:ATP-dependent DNA ligase